MNTQPATQLQTLIDVSPALSFKEIAMTLVKRGIPVIPVLPRQKGTVLKGWQDLATTDVKVIEKWNEENPQYNAGAVAKLDGFWMLDCDVPDLQHTIEKETGHAFPQTFSVRSSKGQHFYFKHTTASQSLKRNIQLKDEHGTLLGDVKTHNSYVVGPGSIHPSGRLYEVVNDSEVVEAPDSLVTWIKEQHEHAMVDEQHVATSGKRIKEGERNNALFKRACKLRKAGLSQSDALTDLLVINNDMCEPALDEAEVHEIIESAYSYPPSHSGLQDLIDNPDAPSRTDLGNALRLVAAEGENIRYCWENKKWYVWNDKMWSKDESGAIYRKAMQTTKGMLHEAADLKDEEERTLLVAYEQRCESEARLNAMVSVARWQENVPVHLNNAHKSALWRCSELRLPQIVF